MREQDPSVVHFRGQCTRIPGKAGQRALHGLVGVMIETPLQVEGGRLVPVALAQRIREAAIYGTAGLEAPQTRAMRSVEDGVDYRLGRRQWPAADVASSVDRRCDQQVRIVGDIRER